MAAAQSYDVAVVGGGAIGLACGWRRRPRGLRTVRGRLRRARRVARGRRHARPRRRGGLRRARAARARPAQRRAASRRSAPSWPRRRAATPATARPARWSSRATRDEAAALDRLLDVPPLARPRRRAPAARARPAGRARAGARPSGSRSTSPATTRSTRAASSRRWPARSSAPAASCARARASPACSTSGARVTGVRLEPTARAAPRTPSCSPPASHVARLDGLPDEARVPVRPVKGQVLRLRDPRGAGLVDRTIRGEQAYLVPRGDGRYVLGATMEERGFDTAPTAGGVYELIRDMSEVVPGVLELEIEELRGRAAPGDPRQPAGDRPRRARRPRLGDRPLPQRRSCSRRSPPT